MQIGHTGELLATWTGNLLLEHRHIRVSDAVCCPCSNADCYSRGASRLRTDVHTSYMHLSVRTTIISWFLSDSVCVGRGKHKKDSPLIVKTSNAQ